MSSQRLALSAVFSLILATVVLAGEGHYDVFVTSSGTSLVIGGFDDTASTAEVPADQMRVFAGEVVPTTGPAAPYASASPGEPGFRAATQSFLNNAALTTPAGVYTALPPDAPLTFSFMPISIGSDTRNLYFWNGVGPVAFAPAAADVTLGLTKQGAGGWTQGITGASAEVIAGNTIQETGTGSAAGFVHTHLFTSIGKAGGAPDQGFYLYSLEMGVPGFQPSAPLYFVFGALDPAALTPAEDAAFKATHELAEVWVENNLAAVPEPSGLALVGVALAGAAGWSRRRGASAPRG